MLTKQWENSSRQKVGGAYANALQLERTSNISDIRESTEYKVGTHRRDREVVEIC